MPLICVDLTLTNLMIKYLNMCSFLTMTRMGCENKFTKKLLENKAGIVITDEIKFSDIALDQVQETIIFVRYSIS